MRAILGCVLGGVTGIGLGFVVYLVLRELVIPYELWSSDPVMWGIILPVAGFLAFLGFRAGKSSSAGDGKGRGGGLRIVIGLLLGMVGGALAALLVAIWAAVANDISQHEGAYAMGVAFVFIPLGALVGAIAGAALAAWTRRHPAAAGDREP